MSDANIQPLIEQLGNKSSAKRRSAAKKLRKLKVKVAGPALLAALKIELRDKRTWETKYHMIMALGESGYVESLDFLLQLTEQVFEATMVHTAAGDAITTLEQSHNRAPYSLSIWIDMDKKSLVEGGIRSLAMNKLTPEDALINKIIDYAQQPDNINMDFWVAAASPGWPINLTNDFLHNCLLLSPLEDTKKAANSALKRKYLKWNPL